MVEFKRPGQSDPVVNEDNKAMHAAATKVLQAGMYLIAHGYGRMAFEPCLGGAGYWRCTFHVVGHRHRVLYRYSQASGFRYLADHAGGTVRKDISPAALAKAIMVSVPESLRDQCIGEAPSEYLRWIDELQRLMGCTPSVPLAHYEFIEDMSTWELRSVSQLSHTWARLRPPPGYHPPGDEPPLSSDPFWADHLVRWDACRRIEPLAVDARALDDNEVLDAIAIRLSQDLQGAGPWDAAATFKMALKASLAALQPGPVGIEPAEFLVALRQSGLAPCLVSLGSLHMVDLPLDNPDPSMTEEEQSGEKMRRLVAAIQLVGRQPDEATFAEVAQLREGGLLECLLAERQQGKFAAQKLASNVIKQAKGQ